MTEIAVPAPASEFFAVGAWLDIDGEIRTWACPITTWLIDAGAGTNRTVVIGSLTFDTWFVVCIKLAFD